MGVVVVVKEREVEVRINTRAKRCLSFLAKFAAAIGDVEGHYNAIAFLEKGDASASLDDDAHVLVVCRFLSDDRV